MVAYVGMAKYNANKVSYQIQERLMDTFCDVLCQLKTKSAIRNFLKDLLNRQERMMLMRRLLIAEKLIEGKTYREIQDELGAGPTTIARVERWLHFGRDGYKQAILAKQHK